MIQARQEYRSLEQSLAETRAEREPALCIDLDGTLVATDTLWETLLLLLKKRPVDMFCLPLWLLRGKAFFKDAISQRVSLNPADLPYCPDVLSLLRQAAAEGREIVLVTAADRRIAEGVAAHLKLFSRVIATDGATNNAGKEKLRAIQAHLGGRPFDYAGDSLSDLPVLKLARQAWLVRPTKSLARHAAAQLPGARVLAQRRFAPKSVLKALRVQQWVKNLLLFVPLFTAHKMTDAAALLSVCLGAIAFSFCASSIYIANDLLDLEDDRANPAKRHRPFASGALPIPWGVLLAAIPLPVGFLLSVLLLPPLFTAFLGGYALLASAYLFLKRFELVDVMVLVALYDLRILAGGAAAVIPVSPWMLGFSMFLFISLAFLKRYSELRLLREMNLNPVKGRGYDNNDEDLLRTAGLASGYMSVLVLVLYINTPEVTRLYDRPHLLWLIAPCLLYWITRAWLLAQRGKMHSDPIIFALTDPSGLVTGSLATAIVVMASV